MVGRRAAFGLATAASAAAGLLDRVARGRVEVEPAGGARSSRAAALYMWWGKKTCKQIPSQAVRRIARSWAGLEVGQGLDLDEKAFDLGGMLVGIADGSAGDGRSP